MRTPTSPLIIAVGLFGSHAVADHHGGDGPTATGIAAGVALVAAGYDTGIYGGDYEGISASVRYAYRRWAVGAGLGMYRLQENGRALFGIGDVTLASQATLIGNGDLHAGVSLAVSLPTGSHDNGLGMGHLMAMPSIWGGSVIGRVAVRASVGYGRALDTSNHVHGSWPLVEPMNQHELTWTVGGDVALVDHVRVGAKLAGAHAIGEGSTRITGGVRAVWRQGRIDTGLEVQAGLVGDPFTVRGIVDTMLHF